MSESSQPMIIPLLPVELRYFAAARDDWELLLLRARQLGAHTIVAAVPWAWHAPTPHGFDFEGASEPGRDLLGFVGLCGQVGLQLILQAGPMHGDALLGGGVPAWLLQQHPQAAAQDQDQQPWRDASGLPYACALHPEYLAAAREWIAAFSAALLAAQSPAGPIVGLHVGGASSAARVDYNQAAQTYANRPRAPGELAGWYDATAAALAIGWLSEQGWRVPLWHGAPGALAPPLRIALHEQSAGQFLLNPLTPPGPTLLRADGSARPAFWRAKSDHMLIGLAGDDFARARPRADLALGYVSDEAARTRIDALARRLTRASVTFDRLELDLAAPSKLASYTLVVVPTLAARQLAAPEQQGQNIAWLDDGAGDSPTGDPSAPTLLPAELSAEQLAELVEERGGIARYAWADGAEIDLSVRYGEQYTYLRIDNRRASAYNGVLAYRGRDDAVLHLHAHIGSGCAGTVLLVDDEVYGAAIDGEGAEGGWLARGLRSSAVFNNGAGALLRCGAGLLLMASQSGRFQTRWIEEWPEMQAYRLLLSGGLLPAVLQIDATHLSIPYIAEDAQGQTDMYLVLPQGQPLPLPLRDYLAAQLAGRAAQLRQAAQVEAHTHMSMFSSTAAALIEAADALGHAGAQLSTIEHYDAGYRAAEASAAQAGAALGLVFAAARGSVALADASAALAIERHAQRIKSILASIFIA